MIEQILISTIALLLLFGGSAKAQGYEGKWWTSVVGDAPGDYPDSDNLYIRVIDGDTDVHTGSIYIVDNNNVLRGSSSEWTTTPDGKYYNNIDVMNLQGESPNTTMVRIIYSDGSRFYVDEPRKMADIPHKIDVLFDNQSPFRYIQIGSSAPSYNFSITFKITDVKWATLMLPFDCDIPTKNDADEKAEIMALKSSSSHGGEDYEGKIYLTLKKQQGDQFIANTPYILYGTKGTYTVTGTIKGAKPITVTQGYLTGNNAPVVLKQNDHAMQNHSGVVGYYNVPEGGTVTLPAYRAFMTAANADHALKNPEGGLGSSHTAKELLFMIEDDDPTFINKINNENVTIPMFDLSGRPVNVPVKGNVYIKNGKKILK